MGNNIQKNINRTRLLLKNLNIEAIENGSDISISQKDIFWQCDHICRAIVAIINGLNADKDESYQGNMSLSGKLLVGLAYFPRGRGKAPKVTMTDKTITRESLIDIHRRAIEQLDTVHTIDHAAYFKHPLFGQMNLKWASRLIYVHTKHHSKIVKEIAKK